MPHLGPSLRRSRRRVSRPWRRTVIALVLSLLLNVLIASQMKVNWVPSQMVHETAEPVSLAPLSASEWEANRAVGARPLSAPSPKALAPPVPPAQRMPGQVVDVAPSADNRAPQNTRFVSDRNNRVEKETRSRYAKAGYKNTLAKPSSPSGSQRPLPMMPPPPAPPQEAAKAPGKEGAPGKAGPKAVPEQKPAERLAMNSEPAGDLGLRPRRPELRGQPAPAPGGEGQGGESGQGGKPGAIDPTRLAPSASFYDRLSGGPAPDRLEGVDEGEGTFLNTREWKYATYFNRIKQAVASAWDPHTALSARDPTGRMFAYKDRITIVAVTLDDQGSLTDLAVQKSCGVDFLDRAALEAFRKAQPFVNPPRGLADTGGQIKFTFGFYLEVGSPGFRLFRPGPSE